MAINLHSNESSILENDTDTQGNDSGEEDNHEISDDETVHSAESSDDYYIHCTERPINYYRNQIIFEHSRNSADVPEAPFTHFNRTTIHRNDFDEQTITETLKKYHNNKQTAIMAPETLIPLIQEVYKQHFNQNGHFILTQNRVEDVTDEERQDTIISEEHERAHRGTQEVENQLKRAYFFPKMASKIKIATRTCKVCNIHKYERKPYNIKLSPRPTTDKPFDRVHMDIFQINKHNFLSLVDAFSKHAQMILMDTKNLTDVKNALSQYFSMYGTPRQIITDHETTFRSLQLKNFLDNLNVELGFASSSESNGQVEKTHSTIIEIVNTNKHKFANLNTTALVCLAISLYNTSIHSSTKFSPNEVIFNFNNIVNPNEINENAQAIFSKVKENINKASKNQEKQNNQREEPPLLEENQEVFVIPNIRKKLDPRAKPMNAKDIQDRTFKNNKNVKRHKSNIKRLKNQQ